LREYTCIMLKKLLSSLLFLISQDSLMTAHEMVYYTSQANMVGSVNRKCCGLCQYINHALPEELLFDKILMKELAI